MFKHTLRTTPSITRLHSLFHQSNPFCNSTRPEQIILITRLLTLHRYTALNTLKFTFTNHLLNQILTTLKLNPTASLHFFNLSLTQQPSFKPSLTSYCKLIHILSKGRMFNETNKYLRVLVGSCEGEVLVNEVVRVYKEFGFSSVVFEILLRVFVENGLVKNGLKVFDEMCGMGRVVSLGNCNALLSGLVKEGEFGDVFGVFEQMGRVGVVPDVWTCSIVVNAYCKDGRVGKGVEFLRTVEEEYGVEVNVVTYHGLINGYVCMGDVEGAKGVLEVMRGKGVLPNVVTYTLFVKGYCKLGNCNALLSGFDHMGKIGVETDLWSL